MVVQARRFDPVVESIHRRWEKPEEEEDAVSVEQQRQEYEERRALAHDTSLEAELAHRDTAPHRQDAAAMHRMAIADVRQVTEELREAVHCVRQVGDEEPSEMASERLERLEERMGRLEERVYQIEEQLLRAGEALRHAAMGMP